MVIPIVVWLKSSLRVNENPAADVGQVLAHSHNLPLLIYQGIDERYPHASLRHHNMLLESSVDLDEGFRQQGLRYVLHVARRDHRPPVMKSFATQASCIVTDLFPLPPWTDWTRNWQKWQIVQLFRWIVIVLFQCHYLGNQLTARSNLEMLPKNIEKREYRDRGQN